MRPPLTYIYALAVVDKFDPTSETLRAKKKRVRSGMRGW